MMMVPAQIRPSKIHGLGIFSILPIPQDTVVWRYCEPVDYRIAKIALPADLKEFAEKYAYIPKDDYRWEFCGDSAMFINHSMTPNVIVRWNDVDDMIAARDIAAGEEITANYFEFDDVPESGGKLK